jgi:hypothetical protein
MYLQNVGIYLQVHMALQSRRQTSRSLICTPDTLAKRKHHNVVSSAIENYTRIPETAALQETPQYVMHTTWKNTTVKPG